MQKKVHAPIPAEVECAGKALLGSACTVHSTVGPGFIINFDTAHLGHGIKRMVV
jgi:hypothetical protein